MILKLNTTYLILVSWMFFIQLSSCANKPPVTMQEYAKVLNDPDGGFIKQNNIGELSYTLYYRPTDYLYQQNVGATNLNRDSVVKELEKCKRYEAFVLLMKCNGEEKDIMKRGVNSAQQYENNVQYYNFGIANHLTLVVGKDTLSNPQVVLEPTLGVNPVNKLLITFEWGVNKKIADRTIDRELIFNDSCQRNGPLHFRISGDDLSQLPQYNIELQ